MRVLMVFIGLAATPIVAAVSQDRGQSATTASETGRCVIADDSRSSTSWTNHALPDAQSATDRRGCSPVPPAPPEPPPPPQPSGNVGIRGKVYNATSMAGLTGWTVHVTGPTTTSVLSDGAGAYTFTGLAAGTYVVCEVLQVGWAQTQPSSGTACPTGFGYRFTLAEGQTAAFVNFGNVVAQN